MKKLIVVSFAVGISFNFSIAIAMPSTAAGINWQKVKSSQGSQFYIDRASVRMEGAKEGDRRKIHTLISYNTEQIDSTGTTFWSESFIDVVSCSKRTITTLSNIQFNEKMAKGKITKSHKMTSTLPQRILPGSVNEYMVDMFVCDIE
ncbi:surface-adhesin E family protein [Massilia sp. SR12]